MYRLGCYCMSDAIVVEAQVSSAVCRRPTRANVCHIITMTNMQLRRRMHRLVT